MRKTKLVAVWVLALTGAGAVQGLTLGNETGGTLLSAAKPTTYATSTDATGGEYTDCRPSAPQITFEHGYTVSMCIEYERDGELVQADAFDFGLGSRESGLLYFFDADNAEVLIKVLDACAVNNHRWVFVAPVTTLAFNLRVDDTATGLHGQHVGRTRQRGRIGA